MGIIKSAEAENDSVLNIAKLMLTAARTAPKAGHDDSITTAIITGDDKDRLRDGIKEKSRFRDAQGVQDADVVVLIGVKWGKPTESRFSREVKLVDLGIAVGSAVKTASIHNADNRIMLSVGETARQMELLDGDYMLGIPISIKGKNIFFDRLPPSLEHHVYHLLPEHGDLREFDGELVLDKIVENRKTQK